MTRSLLAICLSFLLWPTYAYGQSSGEDANWYRPDPENLVVMRTSKGDIVIELAPEAAPKHVERIRTLVRQGKYDGIVFHRVIDGFMAQGGNIGGGSGLPDLKAEFTFRRDPKTDGLIYPGEQSAEGFHRGFPVATQPDHLIHLTRDQRVESWIRNCPGVVSMARTGAPDSANSQFFLMTHTSAWLDKNYTAFGRMLSGLDVARALNKGEPPKNPDKIISARLVSEMAQSERPEITVMRPDGPMFASQLKGASGDDICNLPLPEARVR